MKSENATMLGLGIGVVAIIGIVAAMVLTSSPSDDSSVVVGSDSQMQVMDTDKSTHNNDSMMNEKTIAELAVGTEDLSTLVAALQAADLVSVFTDESAELTVFAPTNDAFAAIQDTVDELLLPENKDALANILKYHVVAGKVMSSDLSDGMEVTLLNGDTATVSISDGVVKIGDATVVTADVKASNGVVHIIDTVLVP